MNVLGVIPARGGSKGIPGKNKKLLLGKPLILYTIEAAINSKLSSVVVSTDDYEIAEISEQAGIPVIHRPVDLAEDNTPTLPVIQHALSVQSEYYEAVMTLQPTSPLRTVRHINDSLDVFNDNPDADSLVSVTKVPHTYVPESLMVMEGIWLKHWNDEKLLRRQDKPVYWARNGAAIYITRTRNLVDYIVGGKILPFEMKRIESIDVDNMEDWTIAELLLKNLLDK